MKKYIILVLAIVMVFASCSVSENQSPVSLEDQRNELSEEELEKAMAEANNDIENRPDHNVCYVSIICERAVDSGELSDSMLDIIPSDGIILDSYEVSYDDGATAFDALLSAVKENKIHFEYSGTKSVPYLEGINNLYEFDCGSLSGWMYMVNGWFPSFGIGQYKIERGDHVEILFTCDLGKDIGDTYSVEGKK